MMTFKKGLIKNSLAVTALALALPMATISTGNALPAMSGSTLSAAFAGTANDNVTQVYWRGRGWGGRGWGWGGVGAGIAAGALIGGAIAANSYPYGYGYGYGPGYYYAPAPGYVVAPAYSGGDAEAYCMQRYRSYDPASGTYLNYDGNRYPCP
ncbi:MAG: BA14K family protein [Xanthobacteraceae bacterium]|nr:BA14K family protein [Xanthobacteraceae bacterium]